MMPLFREVTWGMNEWKTILRWSDSQMQVHRHFEGILLFVLYHVICKIRRMRQIQITKFDMLDNKVVFEKQIVAHW